MAGRVPQEPRTALLGFALVLLFPTLAAAQVQDARLPGNGKLWVEITPSFENWNEQFAQGSPIGVKDGRREPLTADFNGPIVDRLFPGISALTGDLNADAAALGFSPLSAADVSLGDVNFSDINVDVRKAALALELGVTDRLALDLTVPFAFSEVEPSFAFDSASATLGPAAAAIPDPAAFFGSMDAGRAQLQALLDGGTLSAADAATAQTLLQQSGAFEAALMSRVTGAGLLPLGSSAAGAQIAARYASFTSGFSGFGLAIPSLLLPAATTSADMAAFLAGPPVSGEPFGVTERGWNIGEIEVGGRIKLIDSFGAPESFDSASARRRGLRLRTTIGAKLRVPLLEADRVPFLAPQNFLGVPIGDGQKDVEIALYQDVRVNRQLLVVGILRYGVQLSDQLTMRVHPPDRPLALASTQVRVNRDLGDYFAVRLSPRLRLNDVVSFGAEYSFWHKGRDAFSLVSPGGPVSSAAPLAVETSQTRHRVGIGVFYRTTDLVARGQARIPVEVSFLFQTAVAGSGGQTPASQIITASLRFPIRLFGGGRKKAPGADGEPPGTDSGSRR